MPQNNVSPLFFTNFLLVTCRIKSRIDASDVKLNFFLFTPKAIAIFLLGCYSRIIGLIRVNPREF